MTPARVLIVILILLAVAFVLLAVRYGARLLTVLSIRKRTDCEDGYDLYSMDVKYRYDLDRLISEDLADDQTVTDLIFKVARPIVRVYVKPPKYGCSVFGIKDNGGHHLMGRNYDFDRNSSAMVVRTSPKNGYRAIGTAALDHLAANQIDSFAKKSLVLTAPFICLDGMNEKGVCVAVLWVDSEPTAQKTGKPRIFTTLAIRLILDRAATTQEAVDLLRGYDMFAVSGGDYKFFITDAAGDGRVVEYDPHSETREIRDIPARSATNFYQLYMDKVLPNQNNGIYGHGRERYDVMEEIFAAHEGAHTGTIAWEALQAAWQEPGAGGNITSNTQWSIVYDSADLTAEYTIRRHKGEVTAFRLDTATHRQS